MLLGRQQPQLLTEDGIHRERGVRRLRRRAEDANARRLLVGRSVTDLARPFPTVVPSLLLKRTVWIAIPAAATSPRPLPVLRGATRLVLVVGKLRHSQQRRQVVRRLRRHHVGNAKPSPDADVLE